MKKATHKPELTELRVNVYLPGIGMHPAKRAAQLTAGDVIALAFGKTETVVSVSSRGNVVRAWVDTGAENLTERSYLVSDKVAVE